MKEINNSRFLPRIRYADTFLILIRASLIILERYYDIAVQHVSHNATVTLAPLCGFVNHILNQAFIHLRTLNNFKVAVIVHYII